MELVYKNKKSFDSIIQQSKQYKFNENIVLPLLIYGDNFKGLSSLLNSGFKGKIDLIYIDPPFNTKQKFFISDNRKNTISSEKNGYFAYADNYSIEDYLEFIRERIVLLHELLSNQGSLYFHIDTKIGHYCKLVLDEIFGKENFKNDITRIKSNPKNFSRTSYGNEKDMILFYAKNAKKNIWNNVTESLTDEELLRRYTKQDDKGYYTTIPLHAPGETKNGVTGKAWRGMLPPAGRHWRTNPEEFDKLDSQGMIEWSENGNPRIKKYAKEHKGKKIQDVWIYKDPQYPNYPTQKNEEMIKQIILQSSNIDSIILDCFAGGGTTLISAEKTGRKWIGIDNSIEAIKVIEKNIPNLFFKRVNI